MNDESDLPSRLTGDPEMDAMLRDCIATLSTKGQEYTGGSVDRLANFRGVGQEVGIPMEKAWYTFFNKHIRAIQSYIKNGCVVKSEPIHGRIMDCIVYLLLFDKMSLEIEREREKLQSMIAKPPEPLEGLTYAQKLRQLAERHCEDCWTISGPFTVKGDHHGGNKHVCEDRVACNKRSPG